jgi:hypothetical protein
MTHFFKIAIFFLNVRSKFLLFKISFIIKVLSLWLGTLYDYVECVFYSTLFRYLKILLKIHTYIMVNPPSPSLPPSLTHSHLGPKSFVKFCYYLFNVNDSQLGHIHTYSQKSSPICIVNRCQYHPCPYMELLIWR